MPYVGAAPFVLFSTIYSFNLQNENKSFFENEKLGWFGLSGELSFKRKSNVT